jgi:hypothetical protein
MSWAAEIGEAVKALGAVVTAGAAVEREPGNFGG